MKTYYKYRAIVIYHPDFDARIICYHPNDGWITLQQSNALSYLKRVWKELPIITLAELESSRASIESQFSK